jgi:integrase
MGVKVRQKTKGKGQPWWVFVTHNGQRTSRKVGSKKAAQDVASKIEAKLQLGEFGFEEKKPAPTFKEYSKKWLEGYVKINLRESTFDEYECVLRNHVLPVLKNKKIDSINRGEVRDLLLSKFSGGLSQKRVLLIKDVISGVLNYALDEELIKINPTSGITKRLFPKNGAGKKTVSEKDVFTTEELDLFLETCESDYPQYYSFFLMGSRTGMRLGELLALRWGDVDLENGFIWVRRSYRRGRFTKPKNGKIRKVEMSDQLVDVLKSQLKGRFKEVSELVHQNNKNIMEQNYIRRVYFRILKKAKVRKIKLHGLRHAFCTHLLSAGVSPYYVSQQAGHSSISITCDVYGSWISTDENRHVNLLDSKHPNAPHQHPTETEKPQPVKIAANSL